MVWFVWKVLKAKNREGRDDGWSCENGSQLGIICLLIGSGSMIVYSIWNSRTIKDWNTRCLYDTRYLYYCYCL